MPDVRRTMLPLHALGLLALVGGVVSCGGGGKSETADADTAQRACAGVQGRVFAGATVMTAGVVAASGVIPAYCRVEARIDGRLNLELRVPHAWNGKLHYGGGGGYNGSIPPLAGPSLGALIKGYASVASDSGHQGNAFDASWVLNDADGAQLFGSGSVPLVAAAAVEMIRSALGTAPSHSYFEGCSGGGREALMMAQRHPDLFDGIIARAPAYAWTAAMGAFNRTAKALAVLPGGLGAAKLATLAAAVRQACDGADGIVDGVVSHPAACAFDPQTLRCPAGADSGSQCLSDAQLTALTAWTTEASFAGGAYRYPGWGWSGNEDDPDNWAEWVSGNGNVRLAGQFLLQDATIKAYLARNLAQDSLTYTPYDQDPSGLQAMAALNDATDADLRPLAARQGKLLLWHGGADAVLSPRSTSAYYQAVVTAVGGQASAEAFMRYYVAPGVNHCGGGAGADEVDLLAALDAWVTTGTAPGTLTASKVIDGGTALTRPLCVWPRYPRYTGPANDAQAARSAANYTCTAP